MSSSALIGFLTVLCGSLCVLSQRQSVRVASLTCLPVSASLLFFPAGNPSHEWWHADRLGVLLGASTLAIGLCVCAFSVRQFAGERRGGRILSASLLVLMSVVATDLAQSFAALMISWTVTSVSTVVLLGASSGWSPRSVARRAARTFVLSDVILVLGVVGALWSQHISWGAPMTGRLTGVAGAFALGVACVAAVRRAGLGWGRSWVTATVNAPSSVSALLHAGVVNAGALLILRIELVTGSGRLFLMLMGALCVAVLAMLAPRIHARADLKGQLAASTVAQMAFMLLAIALGWPVLAITHLVGHGFYKAGRFMATGAAIETRARIRRRRFGGAQLTVSQRVVGSTALLALLTGLGVLAGGDALGATAVFAPASVALWWLRSASPLRRPVLSWVTLLSAIGGYELFVAACSRALNINTPLITSRAPWWSVGSAALAVALLERWSQRQQRRPILVSPLVVTTTSRQMEVAA